MNKPIGILFFFPLKLPLIHPHIKPQTTRPICFSFSFITQYDTIKKKKGYWTRSNIYVYLRSMWKGPFVLFTVKTLNINIKFFLSLSLFLFYYTTTIILINFLIILLLQFILSIYCFIYSNLWIYFLIKCFTPIFITFFFIKHDKY